MIADAGVHDHVPLDWLRHVDLGTFELPPDVLGDDGGGVGGADVGASSVVVGGSATASGEAQDAGEVLSSPVLPPPPGDKAWALLRPWKARGHSCIEAP
eukprot:8865346-Pyramimonas_sp.AAC.1